MKAFLAGLANMVLALIYAVATIFLNYILWDVTAQSDDKMLSLGLALIIAVPSAWFITVCARWFWWADGLFWTIAYMGDHLFNRDGRVSKRYCATQVVFGVRTNNDEYYIRRTTDEEVLRIYRETFFHFESGVHVLRVQII